MRLRPPELAALFRDPLAVAGVNACALVAAYAWLTVQGWRDHRLVDFAAFWAAGRAVLGGHASAAYDWASLRGLLEASFHRSLPHGLPIYYPPPYLLMIAPLGALGYGFALAGWVAAGLGAYLIAARLAGRRLALVAVALGAPGVLACVMVGQNGLFTAALLMGGLALSGRRPWLAGVLLGLMVIKPQLALVAPIALIAGGRWRTLTAAALTAALALALSGLALGWEVFPAFIAAASRAQASFASHGWLSWSKVQTVYGTLRAAGAPAGLAVAGHAAVAAVAAAAVADCWRRGAPEALAISAAGAAVLLLTPYAFASDAAVLGLALAFLLADAAGRAPLTLSEMLLAAMALVGPLLADPLPAIPPCAALLLALAWRRARRARAGITEISHGASHPSPPVKASS